MTALALPAEPVREGQVVLEAISLGGGLQSSGLCEMVVEGVLPRPTAVVFADTQGEMPETYAHVEYLTRRLATVDVPLYVVTQGSLERDIVERAGRGMQPNPPVRVLSPPSPEHPEGQLARINSYRCSYDYKRRVVEQKVKQLCGGRGAWKKAYVRQWIGYSTDEGSRVKQPDGCRCGHKLAAHYGDRTPAGYACLTRVKGEPSPCRGECTAFDPWQVNRFPLIELGMRRSDVTRWLRERNLPVPPRSACFFCPNRGNSHWRRLRAEYPDQWQRSVDLDRFVRRGLNGVEGTAFVHQSGVPLEDADLRSAGELAAAAGQDGLFDEADAVAYDCDAGVCFT